MFPTIYNPARLIAEDARQRLLGKLVKLPYSRMKPRRVIAVRIVEMESGCGYNDCSAEEVGLEITFDSKRKTTQRLSLDCDFEIFE